MDRDLLDRALDALNNEDDIQAVNVTGGVHSELDTPCIAGVLRGDTSRGEGKAFLIMLTNPVNAKQIDHEVLKSWGDLHAFYGFADSPEYAVAVARGQLNYPPAPQ